MSEPRQIAVVTSQGGYAAFMLAFRKRADDLGLTRETIDAISGLQSGYASKLLAPVPIRAIGPETLGPLLGSLAMRIVLEIDEEMLAQLKPRMVKTARPRKHASAGMLPLKRLKPRGYWRKSGVWSNVMNSRRALVLTPAKRSAIARKAARARWKRKRSKAG
jgi:hypothetical protein